MAYDEETVMHLTPTGWVRSDVRPADAVISGRWCIDDHMFAKPDWIVDWRTEDAAALTALTTAFGRDPRYPKRQR